MSEAQPPSAANGNDRYPKYILWAATISVSGTLGALLIVGAKDATPIILTLNAITVPIILTFLGKIGKESASAAQLTATHDLVNSQTAQMVALEKSISRALGREEGLAEGRAEHGERPA